MMLAAQTRQASENEATFEEEKKVLSITIADLQATISAKDSLLEKCGLRLKQEEFDKSEMMNEISDLNDDLTERDQRITEMGQTFSNMLKACEAQRDELQSRVHSFEAREVIHQKEEEVKEKDWEELQRRLAISEEAVLAANRLAEEQKKEKVDMQMALEKTDGTYVMKTVGCVYVV